MVLDNLGSSLKQTIKKIANAVHVDAKLIKEIVRDIQRALLQADVNVKLVIELTKKIEQRALEEKPPAGMNNREHVIRIVYDELVNIIGDSRELPIKKQVIMMVGLYGQGKCVHGETEIILDSGEILKVKNLYKKLSEKYIEQPLADGAIIDISHESLQVPSFNPILLKTENKKVSYLWKLKGKNLLQVQLDAGNDLSVKVTPEHPFYVLRNGLLIQSRADELQPDDTIAVPRKYTTIPITHDFFDTLKKLDLDIVLNPKKAKADIYSKYNTLIEALNHNKTLHRNYCKFTINLNKGRIPISLVDKTTLSDHLTIKLYNSRKIIQFPRFLTPELAEFIGYFIGDGHLTDKYLEITSADNEIIHRIKDLAHKLFDITPSIKKDKRSNVYRINLASVTLTEIFKHVFNFNSGKKGTQLHIPSAILSANNNIVAKVLQAYFDCDGSICKTYRLIELISESERLIQQVNLLLKRFGIFSGISKKYVHSKPYWKLTIEARYAELFDKKIGSRIQKKKERLTNFTQMGIRQGCGKHDMIPLGQVLKDLRKSLGFSIGQIQQSICSYGIYEKKGKISRENLIKLVDFYNIAGESGRISTYLKLVQENRNPYTQYSHNQTNAVLYHFSKNNFTEENSQGVTVLTKKGEKLLNKQQWFDVQSTLELLKNLAYSDACWAGIKKIVPIKSPEYVYDLTVEDNHNFIANGIIVHNTTTCGKLAAFFKKKGLRPALIAGDVHRPAAYDQLNQIAEQVKTPFYGDKKANDAVKVIKEGLEKFKRSADVIIVDTSGRHKLEDDLINEMKNIFKTTRPQEKLLVMDAAMGQQAGSQAKAFHDAIGITGIVLTKLDGTAKGGGALSAAAQVNAPIVFIGTGEHPGDFERFDPAGFISRLLGMGDLKALLEKAEESLKGKDAEKTARRIMSGKFTLHDMYDQMDMLSGMGPLSKVTELLPGGFSGKLKDVDVDDTQHKLQRFRVIMDSMTEEEMSNPDIIRASRVRRIARGAGMENRDVKELLKYYNMTKKMMKGFAGNRKMRKNLMRQLQFGK